jgi:GTP-binding protein Era
MKKSVFAAIIGRANAGKSSLLNFLVGEKVAIVSEKPQTTRNVIQGILTKDNLQYIFVDTPGLHKPRNKLSGHMTKLARTAAGGVDAVIFVKDVTKRISEEEKLMLGGISVPTVLLLNKVDLVRDKTKLLGIIAESQELHKFTDIIPVSILKKDNTEAILPAIAQFAKEDETGEHPFPEDMTADNTDRFWLSEIVREKILRETREEIPHGTAVYVESFDETKTNKGVEIIDAGIVIVCEKDSHKGIIIGRQGLSLKKIGSEARKEAEEYFGCRMNMKIWVKVKENWRNKESFIAEMGLNYTAEKD